MHRDDQARPLVHRGTACREPSSCFQTKKRRSGMGRDEEYKDNTGTAPKVGSEAGMYIYRPTLRSTRPLLKFSTILLRAAGTE